MLIVLAVTLVLSFNRKVMVGVKLFICWMEKNSNKEHSVIIPFN